MRPHRTQVGDYPEAKDALLSAEALVSTEHADRYLARLSRHASQMNRQFGAPGRRHQDGAEVPGVTSVESSDVEATLTFGEGRCLVWARPEGLKLRLEAADGENLRRLQEGVAKRLQTLGAREGLQVTWSLSEMGPALRTTDA